MFFFIYFLIDWSIKEIHFIEKIALTTSFTFAFLTFFLYYAFLSKLKFDQASFFLSCFLISCITGIILKKIKSTASYKKIIQPNNLLIVITLLSPLVLASFVFSVYYPTLLPDGIVYENMATILDYTKDLTNPNVNISQPPMVPLIFLIMMLLGVGYGKIVFPLYYLLFLIIFYFRILSTCKSKVGSILSTLVLGTSPLIWWHSFLFGINLISGFYYSLGVLLWFEALKQQQKGDGYALLGGFFLAFSSWCRYEFILYSIVPILLTVIYNGGKKHSKMFLALCLPIIIVNIWFPVTLIRFPNYFIEAKKEFSLLFIVVIFLTFLYFIDVSKIITRLKERINWFVPGIIISAFLATSFFAGSITGGITNSLTSVMRMIMSFLYYPATSLLLILILGFKSIQLTRFQKYMAFTIVSYLSFHLFLYSTFTKFSVNPVLEYLKVFIFFPGNFINSPGVREMIAFYPIFLCFVVSFQDKLLEKNRILKEGYQKNR